MENIFSFVPDQDLNNCRLVCKLWNEEGERTESKRHHVKVSSVEEIENLLQELNNNPTHQVSKLYVDEFHLDHPLFLELARRLSPTTLSNFRVEDCKCASVETLHGIIRNIPNLVKLVVGTVKTLDNRHYHRVFPVFGPDGRTPLVFPNILHLDYISYDAPAPSTLLSSVIKSFPNLVTLTTKNLHMENPSKFDKLALPALKKLVIQMVPGAGLENQHLECFMKLNLKLKELRFEVLSEALDPNLLKSFIESQGDTLIELNMEQLNNEREPDEVPICPFPINLPNLKVISIGKTFVRNLVHVLNSLPSLQSLNFAFVKNDNWAGILPKKIPEYPNILNSMIPWIDTKSFQKLAPAFTGLTALKIHECSDGILRIIFKELKTLRVLILSDGEDFVVTDYGITGISLDDISKSIIHGGQNPLLFTPSELNKFFQTQRKQPYIGDLKRKLYFLSIEAISIKIKWSWNWTRRADL